MVQPYSRGSELSRARSVPLSSFSSPFSLLRNDLDQFFDTFWQRNGWPASDGATGLVPAVNVSETNDGYRVTADLPGLRREDVTIAADGNALVISGSRTEDSTEEGRNFLCRECATGEFARVIGLSEDADVVKATAAMSNGVLTVNVPRSQSAANRRRVIPIGESSSRASSQTPASSGSGATRSGRNP